MKAIMVFSRASRDSSSAAPVWLCRCAICLQAALKYLFSINAKTFAEYWLGNA